MRSEEEDRLIARDAAATEKLTPLGWARTDVMIFVKDGRVYDLSDADLDQIERIEAEHLFVVGYLTRATWYTDAERRLVGS